jgi:hypothetical protein
MGVKMLNVSSWRSFQLKELFNFFRGKSITTTEISENQGNIPCIQSGENNSGIIGYMDASFIDDKKHVFIQGLFLSVARSGTSGCVHVHNRGSYIGDNVYVLKLKDKKDVSVYIFLATLLNKERYKYRYGRIVSIEKYIEKSIKLPVDKSGKPDWDYMETYVKSLLDYSKIRTSIEKKELPLDILRWGRFKIDSLFAIENCKCFNASQLSDGNDVAYIGAKKNDNGVMKMVAHNEDLLTRGNCIVFICDGQGSVGYSNYMDTDFIGSTTLSVGYNSHLNKYIGLFLVTVLDLERPKYSYGRKYRKYLSETVIKLPVDKDSNPDWKYMENYIKALPYSDKI